MNISREPERGAAAVLIAASMVLLMGIAALALDGGRLYDERRTAQNAADHASLAAAWSYCHTDSPVDPNVPIAAGLASALANGYENDGVDDFVAIRDLGGGEFEAEVRSILDTTFARVLATNEVDVMARAVAYCDIEIGLGGYALFASGACSSPYELALTGSQQVIEGGIHSNGGLKLSGNVANPSIVLGPVTYVDSISVTGVVDGNGNPIAGTQVSPLPLPGNFDIEDYAPGGKYAVSAGAALEYYYTPIDGAYTGALPDGLYFAEGDLELDAITVGSATFVARGQISLIGNVNTLTKPYVSNGLSLFSNYLVGGTNKCNETAIKWAGSNHNWSGIQYAPNGAVDMSASASDSLFNGSIIAYNMTLAGSTFNLTYDDSYKGEPTTTILLKE